MKTITALEMKQRGGKWLGEVREWIKWHAVNGDSVTWNSADVVRLNEPLTVQTLECLAAQIAAAAVNEERERESHSMAFLSQALNEGDGTYRP